MKKLIAIIVLLGFVSFAQANDSFVVNAKFYVNKNLIGSPTLVVNSNEEASVSVDNSYSFALIVTPIDDSTVSFATDLKLGGKHMAPSLVVELGKEASINIDGKEMSVLVSKSSS